MKTPAKKKRASGWRLVSDPPKEPVMVLVCDALCRSKGVAVYSGESCFWRVIIFSGNMTHWQPFPALPKERKR